MGYLNVARSVLSDFLVKIIPVQKGLIVCTSFNGHYSDSPKAITDAIFNLYPNQNIVWLVSEKYSVSLPDEVKWARIDSLKGILLRGKAQIIIDNVYGMKSVELRSTGFVRRMCYRIQTLLKIKKNQKTYTFWHGTPLKRMGRDQIGATIFDFSCNNTTMILGSQYNLDIMQRLTFNKINMKLMGTPRNDLLVGISDKKRARIKEKLGLPADKKLILFAPTFRSDGDGLNNKNIERSGLDQLQMMQFDLLFETLSEKFGGEWALVCRFHYLVESLVDWEDLESKYCRQIINGNKHDDMSEYLSCTDILLTDISSSLFDFALTSRPCFLFFPDFEYYNTKERGLYMPLEKLPYAFAQTFDELMQNIKNHDQNEYEQGIKTMKKDLGYFEPGNSAEQIARFILLENGLICEN